MAQFNDFMTRIDLTALSDYIAHHGSRVAYAKGERLVQQDWRCRYVGVVISGYFKYVALNSKGHEVVTGFSFEGEIVTDYVRAFLFDQPSLTSIVAGSDAEIVRVRIDKARRHIRELNPGFVAHTSSNLLQEAYRRYLDLLVKTPAERYRELTARYPVVIQSLSVQEIASYLGVSRRQLYRIRDAESQADTTQKN